MTAREADAASYRSRRSILRSGIAAVVGLPVLGGPSSARPDEYYGRNRETRATTTDGFRLTAASTAWSLTEEAPVEVTTRQFVESTRRDDTVDRIVVRSEVEVADTSRFRTVPYTGIEKAAAGFASYRVEFRSYPYRSVRHGVTATVETGSGTTRLNVTIVHGGEALGRIE